MNNQKPTEEVLLKIDTGLFMIQDAYRPESDMRKLTRELVIPETDGLPRLMDWLYRNRNKFKFFSVKFLREKVFKGDPVIQEALQFAIDRRILELDKVPNPDNKFETSVVRLNLNSAIVTQLLAKYNIK